MTLSIHEFATSRGFKPEELEYYGIEVRQDDTIIIPVLGRRGSWYERTYHPGGSPKYRSPKGSEAHLYNPHGFGPHSSQVWIAEGEWDTLSLLVCGAPALGIQGTKTFNKHWALLFQSAEVVLALDPDEEGDRTADKLAPLFPNTRRFRVPPPYEDVNDWLQKDRDGLTEMVQSNINVQAEWPAPILSKISTLGATQ